MRVLHTVASLDPSSGGPARSVPQLLVALKEEGVEVSLWVATSTNPVWAKDLRDHGITITSVEAPDLSGVSLIHDHGLWLPSNHRVAEWAKEAGIPRIISPRGMLEPWALQHKKWKKRLAWWLYQKADLHAAAALHATAESEAAQFRKLGLKSPVFVIPNGVALPMQKSRGRLPEMSVRDPVAAESEGIHEFSGEKWNPPGEDSHSQQQGAQGKAVNPSISDARPRTPKTALFLGRIHPKKGLPMLVEAWSRVRPPGWRMRVIGPDEAGHRAEIASMVDAAGLTDIWSLEGEVSDDAKWGVIAKADLFVLPTYSENFGISIAEALVGGVPVITTTGAPWKGLLDHHCGWWVNPKVDDLAGALATATTTPLDSLRAMGESGREWVARDFSWKGIALSVLRAYKTLLPNVFSNES